MRPPDVADPREALRRRLYAPGATAEDAQRYRTALGPGAAPEPAEGGLEQSRRPGEAPSGSRRALLRGTVVLLLLAAAVLAVAVVSAPVRPAPPVRPHLRSTTIGLPAGVRTAFVRALEDGRSANFSDFVFQHPGFRPPELTTLTRAATEEHDATGRHAVVLDPSDLADHGGRMTVILILARPGAAGWSATRLATRSDDSQYEQEVAVQRSAHRAGTPVSTTFRYTGAAPTQLTVDAAAGVRWDAVVVFSD